MGVQKTMEQNLQTLNFKANKPSKYKRISPTPLAKLQQSAPAKYKNIPKSDLDFLMPGVSVKIVYEGEEELWLTVESVPEDENENLVYCKVTSRVKFAREIQQNQRVAITKEMIVRVFHHEEDDF